MSIFAPRANEFLLLSPSPPHGQVLNLILFALSLVELNSGIYHHDKQDYKLDVRNGRASNASAANDVRPDKWSYNKVCN